MRIALKALEPSQALVAQPVLGQHAANGAAQHLGTAVLLHQLVHGNLLERARARIVPVVHLAPLLHARRVQRRAIGHHHVVAAVG